MRRALDAAIRAVIFVGAVTILLAVGLVVLVLIAREIRKGEPVVHRHVIDAGAGSAAVVIEEVGRGCHAAAELADKIAFARPIAPQCAAKMIVPFRPAGRKRTYAIAAGADIPGLRNELHAREHRILPDCSKERRPAFEAGRAAPECAREIEPESVDMADLDPVAK